MSDPGHIQTHPIRTRTIVKTRLGDGLILGYILDPDQKKTVKLYHVLIDHSLYTLEPHEITVHEGHL